MVTIASLAVIAFAGTFLIHSIAWLVPALWFARRVTVRPRVRAVVLLIAAIAPIVTASASMSLHRGIELHLPDINIEENLIVRRSIDESGRIIATESGGLTLASKVAICSVASVAIALLLIACVQTVRTTLGRQKAIRDFGRRKRVDSDPWQHAFEEIMQTRSNRRAIRLTHAPDLSSPIALTNEICIPSAWLTRTNINELRVVLAHETEHVTWRDPETLAVLDFLRRSLLWQPLLSVAMKVYTVLVEEACDAAAVRSTGDAQSVARVLLNLTAAHPPQIAFTHLNSGHAVRHRIERIVASSTTLQRGAQFGIITVTLLTVLSAFLPHVPFPSREFVPDVDVRIEVSR